MLRRFAPAVTRPLRQVQRRSFYTPDAGSEGPWQATGDVLRKGMWATLWVCAYYLFYGTERKWGLEEQFLASTTDFWEDDGTELTGEEAVAYHRIWRERIMPFMDELQTKIGKK